MYKRILRCALALLALAGATALAEERQNIFYSTDDEHEALIATPNASTGSCGVERWSVKTGTDADVGLVNLSSTSNNTIVTMRSWPAPNPIPPNNRVSPYETTDWVINATLTQYKLETDSDYHLVIQDASGNTMIAEIPDPACVGTGSPFAAKIQAARAAFDAKYSATTSFQTANIPVQLTGVGMFDFLHGQTGVAPNGIELHPVLNIVFNPGNGNPDFALSATPGSLSENQGASASTTISVTPSSGFTGNVTFTASGVPSGVSASFSPTSSTSSTTLTLSASSTATTGAATITVTGTSGNLIHTALVNLTVNAASSGGGQTAVYNSTLKAPGCATVGSGCDSGPSLLLGRASLSGGAEPNQPNTINNSCADGTSGTFHSDESNDRLAIATTDGSPLAAGKSVKVTATVWAYDGTSDALDLYSAANANSPSWVLLSTITPSAAGAQTLSTSFTLPAGSLQAIRANFRYQGSASPCSTGAYDDHDDLIFAVAGDAGGTPTANFSFTTSGLTANFTDSSTDSGGTIGSHAWTFGDGGTSTAASPSHTYSAAGTYSVTETVTDSVSGKTSSKTSSVSTTAGGTPTANFTFTTSGLTATFADTSTDSGGTISSHAWTFGDGGTSTTASPSHTYSATGTYSVTETVTDSFSGRTSSKTASVTVAISAPTQLLGNTGFESGTAAPWTTSAGVDCPTGCSGQSAHAGVGFAWMNGYGSAHTDTVSQTVTVPPGVSTGTLQFYLHIDTAETGSTAYDKLTVTVGSTTVATFSNVNAAAGYQVHSYNVAVTPGSSLTLKFNGVEDASLQTSFVLDDITLTVQ